MIALFFFHTDTTNSCLLIDLNQLSHTNSLISVYDMLAGAQCTEIAGVCDAQPCENGGRCLVNGNTFSCVCRPPWSGQYHIFVMYF